MDILTIIFLIIYVVLSIILAITIFDSNGLDFEEETINRPLILMFSLLYFILFLLGRLCYKPISTILRIIGLFFVSEWKDFFPRVEKKYYNSGELWKEQYIFLGVKHRKTGPACIEYNNNGNILIESYYIWGKEIDKEEFEKKYSKKSKTKIGKELYE